MTGGKAMQVHLSRACVLSCLILSFYDSVVFGGPCACNSDVTNNGSVQITDIASVRDCINGLCGQCMSSCDVNCDGNVDFYDAGVVACAFNGNPNCCAEADGACTGANNATPPCVVTTDDYCSVFSGTWHGDLTACEGDNAIDIPAVSTWGMSALVLSMLITATLLLLKRHKAHPA
jgi:hypothetical protein